MKFSASCSWIFASAAFAASGCGGARPDALLTPAAGDIDLNHAASAPKAGNLDVIVEPGDHADALVSAIQGATHSVHMTMYLLTSRAVIDALLAQHQQGHEVEVVLNYGLETSDDEASDDGAPDEHLNDDAFDELSNAGIGIVWSSSAFALTHEKCVIIDGQTAWIMTMNTTETAPVDNREYLAVDDDPSHVALADAVFAADFAKTAAPSDTGDLVLAPSGAKSRLRAALQAATTSIDLEGEELSDTDIMSDLVQRAQAGVRVRVVLPGGSDESRTTNRYVPMLEDAGIDVVGVGSPYIHAKAFVVDGEKAYVGSANFTFESLERNRELGVIFTDAAEVAKVEGAISTDFAAGSAF